MLLNENNSKLSLLICAYAIILGCLKRDFIWYEINKINDMTVFETEETEVENNQANKPEGVTRIVGHYTPLILAPAEDLYVFFAYTNPYHS
jgi:hypothetical protein